ncbi:superoxide dismutase SodC [Legionella sp. PATHC032]|uniref:superoxide dismutase SodC n=1 Tax=Legionella sp. PATHC032 TaxID=2992039 RepID=UPI001B225E3D|nr:superoxide dismutase SodC [Legionella sp. PATHC032]MCW8422300.1 superoxide dismutase SodC [Legionella sp. PATHC032]HAZ7572771.1 superoxide dismutase family protein [Legionella pneumophila]HBA1634854.1 superoxide dismutase family protein [Legionella pneumophila]
MNKSGIILVGTLLFSSMAIADDLTAPIYTTGPKPVAIGKVTFTQTPYGVLITPDLTNLPEGPHGFHLHKNADCGNHGMHAEGHYDPQNTNSHQGPYGNGHLGDLPVLYVTSDGKAMIPTLAPRLKLSDMHNLAVMIHADGDTYSDNPPQGGGGDRIACGVIK